MSRLKAFACTVKNEIRPLGLDRLGLPCQLMGSGMAFPWALVSSAELATGQIVEDLQLGIELARAGRPALYCPEAHIDSELPGTSEGISSQWARWEHGHLAAMMREGPALLLQSLCRGDWPCAALAADLMVPPLALLLLLTGMHWIGALLLFGFSHRVLSLLLSSAAAVSLALPVFLAWRRFGRVSMPASSLALAVIYALGKAPLYARFLHTRQQAWVRSRRDHDIH
jgi:cellulose synthase/poly-beta-1,6-N-acetylglucosamine synthase-like glycosyltransferase